MRVEVEKVITQLSARVSCLRHWWYRHLCPNHPHLIHWTSVFHQPAYGHCLHCGHEFMLCRMPDGCYKVFPNDD